MKRILTNPLYNFLFRAFIVLFISSIFWVVAVFYYHENEMANKIHKMIIETKQDDIELFLKVDFEKKNKEYFEFIKMVQNKNELTQAAYVELYNENKKLLLSKTFLPSVNSIKSYINTLEKQVDSLDYTLIPSSQDEAFFYFQDKIEIENSIYYINKLDKINNNVLERIKTDTYSSLFIVGITIFIFILSIFPIIYSQYKTLLDKKNDLVLSNLNMLTSLGNAIAKRDSDTNEHNYRVTYYSIKIAQSMNLDNKTMESLIKGAFIHDIGKIAISDNILLKAGKLTNDEFDIMKTHVEHGIDIVKNIKWLEDAQNVILYHHEKVNGLGYPNGVKKDDIPIEARIFSVADVFDALTSNRPYKKAFAPEYSMSLIEEDKNTHFDAQVVESFKEIYKESYLYISQKSSKDLEKIFEELIKDYFLD